MTSEAIVPDDKDWTWVLTRPCPECGFDAGSVAPQDVAAMLVDNAAAWREALRRPDAIVRSRPDHWSILEYGCHVRDVCDLYDYRLHLMLDQVDPQFPNWDQDATAVAERYGEQDPAVVTDELTAAAATLAASFGAVSEAQWSRTGRRSDGAAFSVDTFARYMIHDPIHHLWDVSGHL